MGNGEWGVGTRWAARGTRARTPDSPLPTPASCLTTRAQTFSTLRVSEGLEAGAVHSSGDDGEGPVSEHRTCGG